MSSKYGRCLAQRSVEKNLCVKKADEKKIAAGCRGVTLGTNT